MPSMACGKCGEWFTFDDGRGGRKYCDDCRIIDERRRHVPKTSDRECKYCGEHVVNRNANAKYCSDQCRSRSVKESRSVPCISCGEMRAASWDQVQRGWVKCFSCRRADPAKKRLDGMPRGSGAPQVFTCTACGDEWVRPAARGHVPKWCPGCRGKEMAWSAYHNRRSRLKEAFRDTVDRQAVFEADGYRCHLCGKKTNPRKKAPHPKAPTVDHIVPVSVGGTHEPANCRTACFLCNSKKGNRGGGEQLLLMG